MKPNGLGPPDAQLAALKASIAQRVAEFTHDLPYIINSNAFDKLDNLTGLLFWSSPDVQTKLEDTFLKSYPADWVSDKERAARLTKIDGEIRTLNVQLVSIYDELTEANLDFLPIVEVDAAVFLGIE